MKPDNPFSDSMTRLCEPCFEKRYPEAAALEETEE
jgi:hypothetical protein